MEPPPITPPQHHRLMCSYGGHIVPKPHDKSLCYVGGETRIVVVNSQTTLSDLTQSLSKYLKREQSFVIKYQLPNEDLDALITVATDEDLENMFEEYERLRSTSRKSLRLRLFLFSMKPDSVAAIGRTKSGDWFLNALNSGTARKFPDSPSQSQSVSVNSLLSLYDDNCLINPTKEPKNDTMEMTSSSLEEQLSQISIVPTVAPAPVISDPGSVSSDGSNSNSQPQIQTSRSSGEYGFTQQQPQFIPQYIQNHHPITPYYQIYPQHIHPVYYLPTKQPSPGSVPYRTTSTGAPMRGNNVIYGEPHLYYNQVQPKDIVKQRTAGN